MVSLQVNSSLSLYVFLTTFFKYIHNPSLAFSNITDQEALLAFKNEISSNSLQALSSWNTSTNFCTWQGVICSKIHQRVVILNMSSLRLSGPVSPQLGNLSLLQEINLQDNNFYGEIPQEIGKLPHLQFLRLAKNSFTGGIPINITRCSGLQVLDLRMNNLEKNIPFELGTLSNLYGLSLSRNQFTGHIPTSIGNLSYLTILSLSKNNLHGQIPNELGKLTKLISFEISSNSFSGSIPSNIYNISTLQIFSVTNNSLSGNFPPNLGLTLPNIESFLADINNLSGSIPKTLSNSSGLVKLSIGDNFLSGFIPNFGGLQNLQLLHIGGNPFNKSNDINYLITDLVNCTDLRVLSLSRIQIQGELPNSIGNLSSFLTSIWLDQNFIHGSIPDSIGNLQSLSYLTIDTNILTGAIPDSIGKLVNMQELYFFMNSISGEIPSSIGNITGLSLLILMENKLEGKIPTSLGKCRSLEGLHLASNRLIGEIPKEVISISSLALGLILYQNFLTGSLPSQVGDLENLVKLDVSENRLSGKIPITLGKCTMLDSLKLEGNSFNGTIPSELKNLKSIQVIDLSRNNLSGQIPNSLGDLRLLKSLNLSFNNFVGEVPIEGVFRNTTLFSVSGNRNLCGGVEQLKLPLCPIPKQKHSSKNVILITTTITVLILFLLALFVCAIIYRKRKTKKQQSLGLEEDNLHPRVSYQDLFKSTNGFSSDNLIGKGRYGSVYKGTLNSQDQIVAIKVLNLQESGASKSFLAECEVLKNLRHRNLVKIITSCSSLDPRGNEFKALVFEFMPNGSLENWLYRNSLLEKKLSFIQRLNIAIDVASALEYLHLHYDTPIAHCDLKPSNVLLDDDFKACVGDFGLARFLIGNIGNSNDGHSSSIGVRGTVGYVAPEYGMGGEVSIQGDIYSFGILLLELFTGKKPTDAEFTDSCNLHTYAKTALPHNTLKIIDHHILYENEAYGKIGTNARRNVTIEESLVSILQIGVYCSVEGPKERMDIRDVVVELHRIKSDMA